MHTCIHTYVNTNIKTRNDYIFVIFMGQITVFSYRKRKLKLVDTFMVYGRKIESSLWISDLNLFVLQLPGTILQKIFSLSTIASSPLA